MMFTRINDVVRCPSTEEFNYKIESLLYLPLILLRQRFVGAQKANIWDASALSGNAWFVIHPMSGSMQNTSRITHNFKTMRYL